MLVNNCGCPLKSSDSNCGLTWRVRGITACQTDTHTSLLHTDYSTLSLSHCQTNRGVDTLSLTVSDSALYRSPTVALLLCVLRFCRCNTNADNVANYAPGSSPLVSTAPRPDAQIPSSLQFAGTNVIDINFPSGNCT
jgi:hypothetical protein